MCASTLWVMHGDIWICKKYSFLARLNALGCSGGSPTMASGDPIVGLNFKKLDQSRVRVRKRVNTVMNFTREEVIDLSQV